MGNQGRGEQKRGRDERKPCSLSPIPHTHFPPSPPSLLLPLSLFSPPPLPPVAFQDIHQCKFQHIQVQAQTNLTQHHSRPLNVPFLTTTPIHFTSMFFGHFSVSVCLSLFVCMSLNNVATMYKNHPVSFKNAIQLFSLHPQCASSSLLALLALALSSSLLILLFHLCCSHYIC